MNSRVSFAALLGMVKPPWKRLGAVEIVPEWVKMIKTEKLGLNTEEKWVLLVFTRRKWYGLSKGGTDGECARFFSSYERYTVCHNNVPRIG